MVTAMPTIIKYIKALVPIRLFNSSLWLEEESIRAIPLDKFNSQEVQDAIAADYLIEINANELPVDVVSPYWRLKGDWDPSNGQLPIGRRIGDSYRILEPGGIVGGTELRAKMRVVFTSLYSFEILGEGAFDVEGFVEDLSIGDLNDVDLTGLQNNQVLAYNSGSQSFEPADVVTQLQDLSDVDVTDLADGKVPVYNATTEKFEFQDIVTSLVTLSDVDVTDLADGKVPVYNATTEKFEFQDIVTSLVTLSDVDVTDLADGKVPVYNATTEKFEFENSVQGLGFIAITDIQAQSPSDNVFDKVTIDDGFVLESCVSTTTNLRVSILATTGRLTFKPSATVNGTPATLSRNALTDVWEGYADITLSGLSPYTITALHVEGATDTATVAVEAAPVIQSILISNAYPNALDGQTEHAAGQQVTVTITSDVAFNAVEITNSVSNAVVSGVHTVPLDMTATLTLTVADRGNSTTAKAVIAKVRDENGSWSIAAASTDFGGTTDGVHYINLNNTRPSLVLGSVTYPLGQSALKDVESATVVATYTNADSVLFTSPNGELLVTDPTLLNDKVVTRDSGSYNVSTPNLQGVVTRAANATTFTATRVVNIANTSATIESISKPSRLRSGYVGTDAADVVHNGATHSLGVTLTQRTSAFSMTSPVGTLLGTQWSTADSGVTYTRSIKIIDSDSKNLHEFDTISITNLAGIVTTQTSISSPTKQFIVGGFTQRTVEVQAWLNGATAAEREAFIGTEVRDTSKLIVTIGSSAGLFTNNLATYTSPSNPATTNYAITGPSGVLNLPSPLTHVGGSYVYVRDTLLAGGNATGTLPVIIEETV